MENFDEWSVEDIENYYGFGDCAVFAIALSKLFDFPIVEFYDKNSNMFHVALVLEGSEPKKDLFLDVFGICSAYDIKKRYGIGNKINIEAKNEQELHKMSLFNDEDIKNAIFALNTLMIKGVFPCEDFINDIARINKKSKKEKFNI